MLNSNHKRTLLPCCSLIPLIYDHMYGVPSHVLMFSWKQISFLCQTNVASLKTRALLLNNHLVVPVGVGGREQGVEEYGEESSQARWSEAEPATSARHLFPMKLRKCLTPLLHSLIVPWSRLRTGLSPVWASEPSPKSPWALRGQEAEQALAPWLLWQWRRGCANGP